MPEPYILKQLGGLNLAGPGGPLKGRVVQHRRLALLTLLATARGRPMSRDKLIATLWPESPTERARHSLSDALHVLHKVLGEQAIVTAGDELWLDPEVVASDVAAFEAAVEGGALEHAVELYGGPFLDGFFVSGAVEFDDWAAAERERLARVHAGALERLAAEAAGRGDPGTAAGWWLRRSAQDPYDARVAVRFMEALAAAGDRAGAIQHAVAHAALLHRELDAEADPVVTDLARRLRQEPLAWTPSEAVSLPSAAERSLATIADPPRRTTRWVPELTRRHATMVGAVALAAVVVVLGIVTARRGGGNPEEAPAAAAPGIAVVPFRVGDQNLQAWREGMVDLLSANLEGVGGLRAIDPRTTLARWREEAPEGTDPDLATALEIARRTGASYAVVGSAVSFGDGVRLVTEIYDLTTGSLLGEARAEGAPDSLFALVDRLSVEILRVILGEDTGELVSPPHLAAVTTTSLPALKAFLAGEARYRRSDHRGAILEYDRAVEADSTFARAYFRLAQSWGWVGPGEKVRENALRAFHFIDRLPVREAEFLSAYKAYYVDDDFYRPRALLSELLLRHPDDPEAWYLLGEIHIHFGAQVLADPEEAQRALGRAIALDPSFAPYRIHQVEKGFLEADSALAASRLKDYSRLASDDAHEAGFHLAFRLAFGDATSRPMAEAALDTFDMRVLTLAAFYLGHARFLPQQEALLRSGLPETSYGLVENLVFQGRVREATAWLDGSEIPENWRPYVLFNYRSQRLVPPAGEVAQGIVFTESDRGTWLSSGILAADQGRWGDHGTAIEAFRKAATERLAAGDTAGSRTLSGVAKGLDGYGAWRRGRPEEALRLLEAARRETVGRLMDWNWNRRIRWWLGDLLLELDRPREASRYFNSLWLERDWGADPFFAYEAGRAYEAAGDAAAAIDAYEYALLAWRNADPEFRPRIEAARRAITRLSRSED